MFDCETIPLTSKACSGKCMGSCAKAPITWVIAACGGMISLFEKDVDGHLALLSQQDSPVAPSVEEFLRTMENASREQKFTRLLVVGSANDVAWLHHALHNDIAKSIAAEIEYPLMPSWFGDSADAAKLQSALEQVFQN